MGESFVKQTFGKISKAGLSLDTFGHSSGMALLAAKFGYDA